MKIHKRLSAVELRWDSMENSESGVNPERYRHCMRGGPAHDESRSLGFFPEKAVRWLKIRKSGDLLKCVTACSRVLEQVYFVCRNYGCSNPFMGLLQPFLFLLSGQ